MSPLVERFAGFLVRRRHILAGLLVLTVLPAARLVPRLQTNNTIESFLAQDDPGLAFYKQTAARFGGDDLVYAAVEPRGSGGVFEAGFLRQIWQMSAILSKLDGVHEVTGLPTAKAVLDEGGAVVIGPLMPRIPVSPGELTALKQRVMGSPTLRRLLSTDGRSTLLVIELDAKASVDPAFQNRLVRDIRGLLSSMQRETARVHLAGNPVIAEAIATTSTDEQQRFSGLMIALVSLFSLVLLRTLSSALLTLAVVAVSVAWTLGLFVYLGHRTNWVTDMIPPILVLVSVSDVIHILARFQQEWVSGVSRRLAMERTLRGVLVPCMITSGTTAAGFASLCTNQVLPMRDFGLYAGLGVMLALAATLMLVPAAICLREAPGPDRPPPRSAHGWILLGLDRLVGQHRRAVLVVFILITAGFAAGIPRMRVETDMLRYFSPRTAVHREVTYMGQAFGGSSPLDIIVDSGRRGGALDPRMLAAMDRLQQHLEKTPGLARGLSLADLVKELYRAMSGEASNLRIPDSRQAVAQLLLPVEADLLSRLVDPDQRVLRLHTHFDGARLGVTRSRELLDELRQTIQRLMPAGVEARITGSSLLFINMDRYVMQGQIASLALILPVLLITIGLTFRSLRMGLLAMVPNVVPIVVVLGLMGWAGVPLDGFTAMIAGIAIGIAVDDTIHFLHHLREHLREGETIARAISSTLTGVGRALVATSVVLALGFWIFCLSDFVATYNFGLLSGLTVVVAMLADLLLMPAVLRTLGVPRGWGSSGHAKTGAVPVGGAPSPGGES